MAFMTTLPPSRSAAAAASASFLAKAPSGTGMPYAANTVLDSHSFKADLPPAAKASADQFREAASGFSGAIDRTSVASPMSSRDLSAYTVQRSTYSPAAEVSTKMLPRLSTSTSSVVPRFGPGKRSPASLLKVHFSGSGGMK